MSYKRHQAVDAVALNTHTLTDLPTVNEFLVTLRGTCAGSGAQNWFTLRPNNVSTVGKYAATSGNFYVSPGGGVVTPNDRLWLGAFGGSFGLVQSTYRLTKSGDYWLCMGQSLEGAVPTAQPLLRYVGGVWDSAGATMTTLRFDTNLGNANLTFTGRLELWYQDA